MGAKKTNRTVPIYPRVQPINSDWVHEMSKKVGVKSEAEFVDKLFTSIRRKNNITQLKGIIESVTQA